MPQSSELEKLESHVRDLYGRVVYTHKTHEKAADILVWRQTWIKRLQLWLSAAVTAGLIGSLLDATWAGYIAVIISFALTILNAQMKGPELAEEIQKFNESCRRYWRLKEDFLSLLSDIGSGLSFDQARSRRGELLDRFEQAGELTPRSSVLPGAYSKARKALRLAQEHTFTQEEIDAFLPHALRRLAPICDDPNKPTVALTAGPTTTPAGNSSKDPAPVNGGQQ